MPDPGPQAPRPTEPTPERPGGVLVVGESLVDIVVAPDGRGAEHVGGSPANVALGLARLGHPTSLATRIGDDERGASITSYLVGHGVRLCTGAVPGPTSTATAHLDADGVAHYDFDLEWDLPEVSLEGFGHVHTGSLAATLEPGGSAVLDLLERARGEATVSYDPNVRPRAMGEVRDVRGRIEECIGRSDVVKASAEDVAELYDGAPVGDVARLWGRLGPELVVVTLGGAGALVHLPGEASDRDYPAAPAEVVDTVGAGDSFMAGLLSGLLDAGLVGGAPARRRLAAAGQDAVGAAVQRALACARWTVERAGASAPTRSDLRG